MKRSIYLIFLFFVFILFPKIALAKIGVGVNTGKIRVDDKLKAGMIYKLPPITVINTGDEPGEYEISISYHQDQPELRPQKEWFIFTPQKFYLEAGKSQLVGIKINLPLTMTPGDYFAYLEGRPVAKVEKGSTTLGVAAASKLYFTVVPANVFYGIYYKIVTFWNVYAPWPQRVAVAMLIVSLLLVFKNFFHLQINLKKPVDSGSNTDKKDE